MPSSRGGCARPLHSTRQPAAIRETLDRTNKADRTNRADRTNTMITKIPKITMAWESSEFRNWDSEHSEN